MTMDKDAVGATGAPFTLEVERGKIAEFARATLGADPAYFRPEGAVVPPTFLTTILFWETLVDGANPWARLKMDQRRGMHAEQEYEFHGPPPRAGDKLTCTSKVTELYEKAGRRGGVLTFAVMVTEFRDATGRLVATAKMTGVETERAPGEGDAAGDGK